MEKMELLSVVNNITMLKYALSELGHDLSIVQAKLLNIERQTEAYINRLVGEDKKENESERTEFTLPSGTN